MVRQLYVEDGALLSLGERYLPLGRMSLECR